MLCTGIYIYTHTHVMCIYIYICMYVCIIYIYICMCMYVYIYIYIHMGGARPRPEFSSVMGKVALCGGAAKGGKAPTPTWHARLAHGQSISIWISEGLSQADLLISRGGIAKSIGGFPPKSESTVLSVRILSLRVGRGHGFGARGSIRSPRRRTSLGPLFRSEVELEVDLR